MLLEIDTLLGCLYHTTLHKTRTVICASTTVFADYHTHKTVHTQFGFVCVLVF